MTPQELQRRQAQCGAELWVYTLDSGVGFLPDNTVVKVRAALSGSFVVVQEGEFRGCHIYLNSVEPLPMVNEVVRLSAQAKDRPTFGWVYRVCEVKPAQGQVMLRHETREAYLLVGLHTLGGIQGVRDSDASDVGGGETGQPWWETGCEL